MRWDKMAEPKLKLGKDLGKGFGKDLGKKHKHSVFGILLILVGVYFLIQDKIDVLNDSKIYTGVAVALILIGVIKFFIGRK
jgi:hypothetical protein